MKFYTDRMLGKLAKLLRLIGYDAEYVRNIDGEEIEKLSLTDAIFLTRGQKFAKLQMKGIYCVNENYPVHQLSEVIKKFNLELKEENFFSRCLECNKKLIPAPEEDIKRRVPEYVKMTKKEFFMCPECRRIYWAGTHRTHMQEIIETVKRGLNDKK